MNQTFKVGAIPGRETCSILFQESGLSVSLYPTLKEAESLLSDLQMAVKILKRKIK